MKRLYIYIIGVAMAAMPTGLTAQNSMSPKTAIMVHGLENMGTRASKQEDKTVTACLLYHI